MRRPILFEPFMLTQSLRVGAFRRVLVEALGEEVPQQIRATFWQRRHFILNDTKHDYIEQISHSDMRRR